MENIFLSEQISEDHYISGSGLERLLRSNSINPYFVMELLLNNIWSRWNNKQKKIQIANPQWTSSNCRRSKRSWPITKNVSPYWNWRKAISSWWSVASSLDKRTKFPSQLLTRNRGAALYFRNLLHLTLLHLAAIHNPIWLMNQERWLLWVDRQLQVQIFLRLICCIRHLRWCRNRANQARWIGCFRNTSSTTKRSTSWSNRGTTSTLCLRWCHSPTILLIWLTAIETN